jgi:ParB family chromosome partitioning protein
MESIKIDEIIISNRIRKDLGDIQGLVNSIKEHGLIEPIVLKQTQENDLTHIELVAGERRLTAMKQMGLTDLEHAKHYIWREDLRSDDPKIKLLSVAIEMEENIRRKELSWVEQVKGKAKLLELMQSLHGPPIPGAPQAGQPRGFGVRSLAAMIGESPENTSNDLDMAALINKLPILAKEPSREAAKRRLELAIATASGKAAPRVATVYVYKIVITCDDEAQQKTLLAQLRSAGLKCIPVVA